MKNRQSRIAEFAKELDFPEDLRKDGYHIEIFNGTVVIDGCRNVAEYGDRCIKLNTGGSRVGVFGDGLTIKSFICSQAVITGKIISLELE